MQKPKMFCQSWSCLFKNFFDFVIYYKKRLNFVIYYKKRLNSIRISFSPKKKKKNLQGCGVNPCFTHPIPTYHIILSHFLE